MWNILIQTACSYTSEKYFKQLIKHQQVAICLQLCSYLQSNLQLCRSLYTWCTEIPQLWDVEKVMWNILIQTACSYTSEKYFKQLIKDQLGSYMFIAVQLLIVKFAALPQLVHLVYGDPTTVGCRESHVEHFDPNGLFVQLEKYFKQLIKDQQVAICLQLCSYLQSNLQLCRSLYTWCTEIPQLLDVDNVMWNILIQTACSYTIEKYFKQLIKYQQLAICLQLCSYLQSNLQLCHSLYTWCTEIPQLLDVDKVMWNFLI